MSEFQSKIDSLKLTSFSEVDEKALKANPGVCFIKHDGQWAYVGMSSNLRRRHREDTQTTGDLSLSALRRAVCEHLEIADSSVTMRKPAQLSRAEVAPVANWLHISQVGWIECKTAQEAEALKAYAIETLNPFLNKKK